MDKGVFEEVGQGVFRRHYEPLSINIGVVVGDDGVMIIDTRASHVEAEEIYADLKTITDLPVAWVVNTHYHWDHTFGNAVFPNAEIWGHVNTRETLLEIGEQMKDAVGQWLGDDRKEEIKGVRITPPSRAFRDRASVEIGREVRLSYHGLAHTNSDIVVEVDGVVFAGDIIEHGAPPAFDDSFPVEWPKTAQAAIKKSAETIVPGHGSVVDRQFVAEQIEELVVVSQLATELVADKTTVEDAVAAGPYPPDVMETALNRAVAVAGRS